jgi:hypothetical protein
MTNRNYVPYDCDLTGDGLCSRCQSTSTRTQGTPSRLLAKTARSTGIQILVSFLHGFDS